MGFKPVPAPIGLSADVSYLGTGHRYEIAAIGNHAGKDSSPQGIKFRGQKFGKGGLLTGIKKVPRRHFLRRLMGYADRQHCFLHCLLFLYCVSLFVGLDDDLRYRFSADLMGDCIHIPKNAPQKFFLFFR